MSFFFFNDTATTEIYTLSLHDALPIYSDATSGSGDVKVEIADGPSVQAETARGDVQIGIPDGLPTYLDRKSTRLNSSHSQISYAVFCLNEHDIALRGVLPCFLRFTCGV